MTLLVGKHTRAIVQGITGNQGAFHTRLMLDYGTQIVAGVTPGKGATVSQGVPVFDRAWSDNCRTQYAWRHYSWGGKVGDHARRCFHSWRRRGCFKKRDVDV